jgi:hypothetical protein
MYKLVQRGRAIPVQVSAGPEFFQEAEDLRFQDSRLMKVVKLSALSTGHIYTPGNIPGTLLCSRLSRPQGHCVAGRITSMKNCSGTIGNRCLNQLSHRVPHLAK